MKLSIAAFYPASSTNYYKGRAGYAIDRFTVHHSAGWENTLRYLWADPARNGSSHFWVGNKVNQIEQYVDTDDTAWTNGNLTSNRKAITVETRGDWRNGYYDQTSLDNLEKLIRDLRKHYPQMKLTYHMDESNTVTLCPADLKHKGWAKKVWDKAGYVPAPVQPPASSGITYKKITPKRIKLKRDANLWNFNFTDWQKAQAVRTYSAGTVIDVVAEAKNAVGGTYYMTAYSYNNGAVRATNGFNVVDCEDYVAQITEQPTVQLKWEAMTTPRQMMVAQDLRVYDLDNKKFIGDVIKEGTLIDFVEKTSNEVKMYLRSKWAKENGKNWGVEMDKLEKLKPETPREPVPEKPIDTNPDVPGDTDVLETVKHNNALLQELLGLVKAILNGLKGVFKW